MRIGQKLLLFALAAAVLPLAGLGFFLLGRAEAALARRIDAAQGALAQATAEGAAAELLAQVDALGRSAELVDWARAGPEEREGALRLLYGQASAVSAVVLAGADGRLAARPVFAAASGRPGFDAGRADALARAVPLEPLRLGGKGQAALGAFGRHPESGGAAVPVAVKLGDGPQAPYAVAELTLAPVEALLARRAAGLGAGGRVVLADAAGQVLARAPAGERFVSLPPEVRAALQPGARTLRTAQPPERVSVAQVGEGLGLWAVVAVDEGAALAPVRALRRAVLLSVGGLMVVLVGAGGLFARRLTGRVEALAEGARALGRGELETRVAVRGQDELSELAAAFNQMGGELQAAQARLLRWNDDLQARVQEATAELRAAQAQLLQAQKLAAVGQLGAGVAHEINNPLAGILGNVQLLLLERAPEDDDVETLRKIEQSAKRCKEITQNLLRFSQQREAPELRPVDASAVVRDVLALAEGPARAEGIDVVAELAPGGAARVRADPGHLSQVVHALVQNARTAMLRSPRRLLTVRTGARDGRGFVEVEDTGKGIAPEHLPRIFEPFFTTKDVWSNVGLGLSVAYRVVSEAGGTIDVQTAVGQGSRFTVWLPLA